MKEIFADYIDTFFRLFFVPVTAVAPAVMCNNFFSHREF